MTASIETELCTQIIEACGVETQILVAVEEMGELMQSISKYNRGQGNAEQIAEEIADVSIMLRQLMLIYGIDPGAIERIRDWKLARMLNRLHGNAG